MCLEWPLISVRNRMSGGQSLVQMVRRSVMGGECRPACIMLRVVRRILGGVQYCNGGRWHGEGQGAVSLWGLTVR